MSDTPPVNRIVNRPSPQEEYETNQQMLQFLQSDIMTKKAKSLYCVMNRSRSTIVKDPGLDRPFAVASKVRAEQVARQVGGVVETLHDAIQYIFNAMGQKRKSL